MASTFGGVSICSAGLYSSQTQMYTSNVNITNAATPGYTRQVVSQTPGYTTTMQNGVVVVGISPDDMRVEQERSTYLDQRYWNEQPGVGEWQMKTTTMGQMESIFNNLDDSGLSSLLDALDQSMENLTTTPQDSAARTEVIQDLVALSDTLNSTAQELYDLQTSVMNDVEYTVGTINQVSAEIASLNEEILATELAGGNASALEDKRNMLADDLSTLTDITVIEEVSGWTSVGQPITSYTVKSGNSLLVSHDDAYDLATEEAIDSKGMRSLAVTWEESGQAYSTDGGTLKGQMDIVNGAGEGGSYKGIPYYMNELDTFAETLVTAMNSIHEAGYGLDGTTGEALFDPTATSAMTIQVSEDLIEHPEKLAVASAGNQAGNSENIRAMVDLLNAPSTFEEGSFNDHVSRMTIELGSNNAYAEKKYESAYDLTLQIDQSRLSVSGVSVDEETANIALQQQIYDATAQMMQVWSEIIETTINQLGG